MKTFDGYIFRTLFVVTVFVSVTLAVVIFLTQSLRFLELVIDAGSSASSFWLLTVLALPRFFEIILPLSLMAATLFVYNRMTMDAELVVIRSAGYSPMKIARPALLLAMFVTIVLWGITLWAAPKSLSSMQHMRQIIKEQLSSFLLREGVFNRVGKGLTVYIRERDSTGDFRGLIIHDGREKAKNPSTILARRGALVLNNGQHEVVVYDGARQEYDTEESVLHRLNFEKYTIEIPDSEPLRERWPEPDERTIFELLNPDLQNPRDVESLYEFRVELHRRIISPLFAFVFTLVCCAVLLPGPLDRRGQGKRITLAVVGVVLIEGLFLAAFNISRQTQFGIFLMYLLILGPAVFSILILSPAGEKIRARFLRRHKPEHRIA